MPTVVRNLAHHRPLAEARRRVFHGALLLSAQQGRLRQLRAAGYNTSLAASLLDTFEDSQLALITRLASLEMQNRG